jgi:ABC-type phosphate transport system permease subunit
MIQMGANSAYQGFLNINNSWAVALFSKHIAIILLVILMGIMTWGVLPALKRISLRQSLGKAIDEKEQKKYGRMEKQLLNGTLVLSVIILLLTAWARSAS